MTTWCNPDPEADTKGLYERCAEVVGTVAVTARILGTTQASDGYEEDLPTATVRMPRFPADLERANLMNVRLQYLNLSRS